MLFTRQSPVGRLRFRGPLTAVLVAVLAVGAAIWLLAGAAPDLSRRHVVAGGVPLDEVHPAGVPAGERRPGVVVAHGFAGSARLMAQFGDTLAARGYVVVLLDFSGHGANTRPLPDATASTGASTTALQHDLDVAMTHLRGLSDVDPARVALVGHSMGATEVIRYALAHPEVTATVAISMPDSSFVPPQRPARLLLLAGGLEFPGFRAAAKHAAEEGGGDRSAVVVPGVEHISILYAPRTHREVVTWLDDSFGGPLSTAAIPSPMRRVVGAGLLLLTLLAGLYPVTRVVLGSGRRDWPRLDVPQLGRVIPVAAVAAAVATPLARIAPTIRLPLALGGYVVGFLTAAGAALFAYQRWRGSTPPTPTPITQPNKHASTPSPAMPITQPNKHASTPSPPAPTTQPNKHGSTPPTPTPITRPNRRRLAIAAPVLIGYAAATIAVPLQLGLTNAVPVGARWWLLAAVWAGFAVLAYAAERVTNGNSFGVLAVSAVAVIGLTFAAVVGLASSFLLLIVPLLAILLLWQAIWSAVLNRFSTPPWLISLVGSLLVAWPIATALPVIG